MLQTGEFERLGSSHDASRKGSHPRGDELPLAGGDPAGRFREDLYLPAQRDRAAVPPLAERRDDVLPLAQHFLEPGFELSTPTPRRALLRHDWPGNVRELANTMRRALPARAGAADRAADLGLPRRSPGPARCRSASPTG